ncbi:MAG: BrnT family toxin [Ruminococcus sp.]|nr:BrnT family toxin [Ruminococcus sp.]
MHFQWDSNKEKINIEKHGIGFKLAEQVFADVNRIELYDEKHSTLEEDRYKTIGMIGTTAFVITVIYTDRDDDVIRIISARRATKKEEEAYYNVSK